MDKKTPILVYLASPYSDPDAANRRERYEAVCRFAANLIVDGYHVFCPIANSHLAGTHIYDVAVLDFDYWRDFDFRMISLCDELIVARLPRWNKSKGVLEEVAFAQSIGKPVSFYDTVKGRRLPYKAPASE